MKPITPIDQSVHLNELGVRWNTKCDQLVFSLEGIVEVATKMEPMKRNVVSWIGQIYDLLGSSLP